MRPLLEDRGRITESIRILVLVDRMKQKCFQITTKRVASPLQEPGHWLTGDSRQAAGFFEVQAGSFGLATASTGRQTIAAVETLVMGKS